MTRSRVRAVGGAALAALAFAAAACGDDEEEPAAAAAPATVSVAEVDGVGSVLVDRAGAALYTADEEADGKIRCVDECLGFWLPLEASGAPTGSDDVTGELGTVERPDGAMQVTYDGKPLYRFSDDTEPGKVTGDGLSDTFGGASFTWHAVTTDGGSEPSGGGRSYGY